MPHRTVLVSLLLVAAMTAHASDVSPEVQLLASSPTCVKERLGQVSVELGAKEPNLRTGMRPSPVSYRQAFIKLLEAARSKGGEAVILRGHEAVYFTKSARQPRRPTFLSLQGAVVSLQSHGVGCDLARLDPATFEREAIAQKRADAVLDTGMAF